MAARRGAAPPPAAALTALLARVERLGVVEHRHRRVGEHRLVVDVRDQHGDAIPLYQRPSPLIYKSGIVGMVNNPSNAGPVWNIEDWRWK